MVGLNQSQIANNLHYNSTPTSTTPNPIALTRNPSTDSLSGLGTPHFNLSEVRGREERTTTTRSEATRMYRLSDQIVPLSLLGCIALAPRTNIHSKL